MHSQESPSYDTHNTSYMISSAPPNPSFSFPAQPSTDNMSSSSRRARRQAPAALPSFSFPQAPADSGAAAAAAAVTVPAAGPVSPTLVEPAPQLHTIGHRRLPSELLGDVSAQAAINNTMTAPSALPHPGPGLAAGQGRGARRHAHRRSQAISSVDLTAVAKAFPPVPVCGSVPTSPILPFASDKNAKLSSRSFPDMYTSQASPKRPMQQTEPSCKDEVPEVPPALRRPLSTISSESSVSTVRPNQIFSDRSGSGQRSGATSPQNEPSARPKTAGAQLAMKWKTFNPSNDNEVAKRPLSASASMALNFNLADATKAQEAKGVSAANGPDVSDGETTDAETSTITQQRTSHERKPSKKQKKKRSWTGILTRKGKKRSSKKQSRKAPTPPPVLTRTNSELGSMYGVDFDQDNTIVIRTPTAQNAPKSQRSGEAASTDASLETAWKPKSFYEQQSNPDIFSPVIDLDAALGPFNTPEMGHERNITSGFVIATKRMYSGGRRGEFVGPEMRYHRRAESAPEMPPFDRSFLSNSRFGLSAAIENPDVFDEEEEDAFLAQNDDQPKKNSGLAKADATDSESSSEEEESDSEGAGLGIQVVDSSHPPDLYPASVESRPSTAQVVTPRTPYAQPIDFESQSQRSNSNSTTYHPGSVGIVGSDSGQTSPRNFDEKRPSTSPEFIYNISNATNLTTAPSIIPPVPMIPQAFPSPAPSNISFDAPRLNTASSSITDRQPSSGSVYSGEPGSDYLQNSIEDVPSLTSSSSTMTGNIPRLPSAIYGRNPGDRAASFSHVLQLSSNNSHNINNNRPSSSKRASIVSFSRLVGATSERSKLSYEEKAPMDEPDKRKKKGHRISRLMQFWKVKDKDRRRE
ncbi:uncharacterized protein GIQ15_00287 [Arthroderma uncinatum]|uniref:uncharacterized protein n=1 Tax=Arthroderma uncinatum TaxID=74035 RepID=UPI00144A53AD|nr:uncharacterized protein GIQ15_00287 [Arthroderma uncinatum]KAF3490770.1 hypothetical protein GIQ15_00287 [Arthroderma uncinatum]